MEPLLLKLRTKTSPKWLDAVLADFDRFLVDHAACERKASSTAMHFVVRYPDGTPLIDPMITLAREELAHFQRVYRLMATRGLGFSSDEKDPYVNGLMAQIRSSGDGRFLDRLLVGGIVEARGAERFGMIAQALEPGDLKVFYEDIARSEARHHELFLELAEQFFDRDIISARLDTLLDAEAEIVDGLAFRPALH